MQPSPGAAESERILAGEGCAVFEHSEFAPAAKMRVDEGSLAQPNLQPGSPFFAYFLAVGALRVSEAQKVGGCAAMKRKVK